MGVFQLYEEWETSPVGMMEHSFDNSHFSFVHKANFGLFDQAFIDWDASSSKVVVMILCRHAKPFRS